jgi:hypothetical protein
VWVQFPLSFTGEKPPCSLFCVQDTICTSLPYPSSSIHSWFLSIKNVLKLVRTLTLPSFHLGSSILIYTFPSFSNFSIHLYLLKLNRMSFLQSYIMLLHIRRSNTSNHYQKVEKSMKGKPKWEAAFTRRSFLRGTSFVRIYT